MVIMWRLRGYDEAGEEWCYSLRVENNHFKYIKGIFKWLCSLSTKVSCPTKFMFFKKNVFSHFSIYANKYCIYIFVVIDCNLIECNDRVGKNKNKIDFLKVKILPMFMLLKMILILDTLSWKEFLVMHKRYDKYNTR